MKTTFKIAKIVNDYTFIINGGSTDGVEEADEFNIVQKEDFEVLDPDTGESLGSYELIKGKIYATNIYPKFSICETRTYQQTVNTNAFQNIIGNSTKTITSNIRLDVDEDQITGGLTPDPIKVGDTVEKIMP